MSGAGSPSDHTVTDPDKTSEAGPITPAPDDVAAPAGTDAKDTDDASSASGGAKKQDDPKPTLQEVLKAAAEKPDPEGKSPVPAKNEPAKVEPDPSDKPDEKTDDSKLSFHNHPRWQEVNVQNRELRTEVETLKPDAEQFRKIDGFMQEHHLTPDEVGEGFILMAMAKNGDPRVLQKLDDFRQKVALAIGEALPDDIQAKVDTGEISDEAAKELAKARATATTLERQTAQREADDLNARKASGETALRQAQAAAVGTWDAEQRKLDPDFARKENAIARYAKALMQEHGAPRSPEEAVNLIKSAYAQVNRDFAAALPPKQPVQRGPIASSATGAKAQPKTFAEAVAQAASM